MDQRMGKPILFFRCAPDFPIAASRPAQGRVYMVRGLNDAEPDTIRPRIDNSPASAPPPALGACLKNRQLRV